MSSSLTPFRTPTGHQPALDAAVADRSAHLNAIADTIHEFLVEAWRAWVPSAEIDELERAKLLAVAHRMVAATAPGAESRAELQARTALEDLYNTLAKDVLVYGVENRDALVVEAAFRKHLSVLRYCGSESVLTAYRVSLEGERL